MHTIKIQPPDSSQVNLQTVARLWFALQTADDDGNAATASMRAAPVVAPKPVRYDISTLEGDSMLAAERFLQLNNAKHLGDGRWESPAPLTRLDKYQY